MRKALWLLMLLLPLGLPAQEQPFAVRAKTRFGSSAMVGYVKEDSLRYYQLRLIQEFKVWKIKFGIDLDFLFDKHMHLRTSDWDNWSDALEKLYFLRYGDRHEPVFVHAGGFPGVTIGNGLIMREYSNMLLYPELRNVGLMFGGRPDWPLKPSFELFSSNVLKNQILSFTARCRPITDTTAVALDSLELGLTLVLDRNQYGNLKKLAPDEFSAGVDALKSRPVAELGLAYTLPVYKNDKWFVGQYAEFAHIVGRGSGAILPGVVAQYTIAKLKLEYRIFGRRFVPAFFDHYYEEERAIQPADSVAFWLAKSDALRTVKSAQGWNGTIEVFIAKKVRTSFSWQNLIGPGLTTGKSLWAKIWVDTQYKRLENVSLSYSKTNTSSLAIHRLNQPNASISAALTLRLSKYIYLIAKYTERYQDKDGDGAVAWWKETKRTGAIGAKLLY